MSATSDAVWIVRDVLEEILGMMFFREVQENFEAEMIAEKDDRIEVNSAADDKCDWVSLIDSEKKWWIDGDCDCDCDCSCEASSEKRKSVDADVKVASIAEINVNDGKTERKERKFPEYEKMKFNWLEVGALYKGQSER